jgi:predicted phage tail protein
MNEPSSTKEKMPQINRALGLFLMVFGIIVLFSIMFTETAIGKVANAGAGAVLTLIGAGMIWFANKKLPPSIP